MIPTIDNLVDSLLFVWAISPSLAPYWARTSRILEGVPQPQKDETISLLKQGRQIVFEASGISIECAPMSTRDRRRLEHLLSFDACGFRLSAFGADMALYYRHHADYCSMKEMIERGFLPTASIAVSRANFPITTFHGDLIDVFVPVAAGVLNFTKAYASDS